MSGKTGPLDLDEPTRVERALALLAEVEILPLAGDLSPEFVAHLAGRALLSKRDAFSVLVAPGRLPGEEDVSNAVDALRLMPGALHLLALGRLAYTPGRTDRFLDRPNILCLISRLTAAGQDVVTQQVIVDIVNNDVAAHPRTDASRFRVRLEQGIVDTITEASVLPPVESAASAIESFARLAARANELVVIRTKGDEGWRRITVGADARARMEEDMRAGYVLVAPVGPVDLNGRRHFGWWRANPTSGEILGVMESGFHPGSTERGLMDTIVPGRALRAFKSVRGGTESGILGVFGSLLRFLSWVIQRVLGYGVLLFGWDTPFRRALFDFLLDIQTAMLHMQKGTWPVPLP